MSLTADKTELLRRIETCTDADLVRRALALFPASSTQGGSAVSALDMALSADDTPLSREEFLRRLRS